MDHHAIPSRTRALAIGAAAAILMITSIPGRTATTCAAESGAQTVPLVELFTSEGCDSCPPADRWLSSEFPPLPTRASPLALAFHVDYWDRLGWRDRVPSAQFTPPQHGEISPNGATFVYTPQGPG